MTLSFYTATKLECHRDVNEREKESKNLYSLGKRALHCTSLEKIKCTATHKIFKRCQKKCNEDS